MLRSVLKGATLVGLIMVASPALSGDWEWSRDWYIEIKRAAKYARIAITATGDLARIDAEHSAASKQLRLAAQLPLPDQDRAVCIASAKAVVDFIAAAKAGNMDTGPASYERQKARWDVLSEDCITAIRRVGNAEEARRP